jgi:hypothetical protein
LTFAVATRLLGKFSNPLGPAPTEQNVELLNPVYTGDVRELASFRLALSYDIANERKGSDSLSDLDMGLELKPLDYMVIGFNGGINPGGWNVTQARASFGIIDPRPMRRVLDPDFSRPNSLSLAYKFLGRGPNGLLAENANINLDLPATCPNSLDPRCDGFNGSDPTTICPDSSDPKCRNGFKKNVVGQIDGTIIYHLHDQVMTFIAATYDVRDNRFPGYHMALKFLSSCECWTATLSWKHEINPAKNSFNFNFSLLGLGAQKNTLK